MVRFFFQQFSQSVCLFRNFGRIFAIYCIAPRNDFRSFVFSGGFSFSIASTFSSFGFIPFSFISCSSHFVSFMKNSDFSYLHGIRLFLIYPRLQTISSRDLVYFPVLLRLYRPTMPVYNIQEFGQFFPAKLWVCRRDRKTLF